MPPTPESGRGGGGTTPIEPPVFVVGCPRTGTTLVGQILDSHSRIALYLETNYYPLFGPLARLYGDLERRSNLRRFLADLVRSTRVQRVTPPSVEMLERAVVSPTLAGVLRAFLHVYAVERGKPRGGEKTPAHYRYLSEVVDGFPDSPVVFLMRDPRDTVRSMQQRFGVGLDEAAAAWNDAFRRYVDASERVHLIRYEELARDPVTVVERMCRFMGEAYEPSMLQFFEHIPAHLRAVPNLDLRLLSGPVAPTSIGTYQELPRSDIRRIEAACAAGMEAMGYPFAARGSGSDSEATVTDAARRPGALRVVIGRLRYYGLNRERWRRGWFRWSLLARLYVRYPITLLDRLGSAGRAPR